MPCLRRLICCTWIHSSSISRRWELMLSDEKSGSVLAKGWAQELRTLSQEIAHNMSACMRLHMFTMTCMQAWVASCMHACMQDTALQHTNSSSHQHVSLVSFSDLVTQPHSLVYVCGSTCFCLWLPKHVLRQLPSWQSSNASWWVISNRTARRAKYGADLQWTFAIRRHQYHFQRQKLWKSIPCDDGIGQNYVTRAVSHAKRHTKHDIRIGLRKMQRHAWLGKEQVEMTYCHSVSAVRALEQKK